MLKNFIDLFNCLLEKYKLDNIAIDSENTSLADKIFIFCLFWAVCGTLDNEQRKKVSTLYFYSKEANFNLVNAPPAKMLKDNLTCFDFCMNWQNFEKEKSISWEKYDIEKVEASGN